VPAELTRRGLLGAVGAAGTATLAGCATDPEGAVRDARTRAAEVAGRASPAEASSTPTGSDSLYDTLRVEDPPVLDGWPSRSYSQTNLGWKPNTVGPTDGVGVEWTYETPSGAIINSSAAVVDGTVFFGSNDGRVYAVDAATGAERWIAATGDAIRDSSPTVVDGRLFVGSNDGSYYAFDAATGDRLWSYATDGFAISSAAVADGRVFFSSRDTGVYAVDAATGEELWTDTETGGIAQNGLAVADGRVYVSSNNTYAFDAASGDLLWTVEMRANNQINGTPTVAGGLVLGEFGLYVGAMTTAGRALGGAIRLPENGWASPAVAGDTVYVGIKGQQPTQTLTALSVRTTNAVARADVRWEAGTARGIYSSPVVVDGTVYVVTAEPDVQAFDAATGTRRWRLDVPAGSYVTPAVVDGTCYVGGADGRLYAIGETG
jgi:outer membrane protein assembly factor BamB